MAVAAHACAPSTVTFAANVIFVVTIAFAAVITAIVTITAVAAVGIGIDIGIGIGIGIAVVLVLFADTRIAFIHACPAFRSHTTLLSRHIVFVVLRIHQPARHISVAVVHDKVLNAV
jgi:hypothetical protein